MSLVVGPTQTDVWVTQQNGPMAAEHKERTELRIPWDDETRTITLRYAKQISGRYFSAHVFLHGDKKTGVFLWVLGMSICCPIKINLDQIQIVFHRIREKSAGQIGAESRRMLLS